METLSLNHLHPIELSLVHNYFTGCPDEKSDEDNSDPPQDYREPNIMGQSKSSNKVTSIRSKRKKNPLLNQNTLIINKHA